jgi:heterokaryon incompatibility protein (HET)
MWQKFSNGEMSLESVSYQEVKFNKTPQSLETNGSDGLLAARSKFSDQQNATSSSAATSDKPGSSWARNGKFPTLEKLITRKPLPLFRLASHDLYDLEKDYSYNPLPLHEIRLLKLLPGQRNDALRGEIRHVRINKSLKYHAISYVWGFATKGFHLRTRKGKLDITYSLDGALRRIRDNKDVVFVWVDAICINQSDHYEKALQVRKLGSIFRSAESVYAYIGEENDNSRLAIQTLLQISVLAINPDIWPKGLPPVPNTWISGFPPPDDTCWNHMIQFFAHSWFRRVWIVQEVLLAKKLTVLYGQWCVDWSNIFHALQLVWTRNLALPKSQDLPLRMTEQIRSAYILGVSRNAYRDTSWSKSFRYLSLCESFGYTESTKELDKMFALLGIANDSSEEYFDPDYHSNLEVVVERYARRFVERGNVLELLYLAGSGKSYEWCSWIPKWTSRERRYTLTNWKGSKGIFRASNPHALPAAEMSNENIYQGLQPLKLGASRFSHVKVVSTLSFLDSEVFAIASELYSLVDSLDGYPTGEEKDALKYRLLVGDAIGPVADGMLPFAKDASHVETTMFEPEDFKDYLCPQTCEQLYQQMLKKPTSDQLWSYRETAVEFLKHLAKGRFFVTDNGYIGCGPHDVSVGDVIVLVDGAAVPFLVRRRRVDQFVGEAYVHGIMYGEWARDQAKQCGTYILV